MLRRSLAFFAALAFAAPAAAVPTADVEAQAPADPVAELRDLVEAMRAEALRPGEVVPGWNAGGADPDSELRTLGADRYYFTIERAGGREVVILTDQRLSEFAPAGWRAVDSYGSAVAYAENPFLQFMPIGARHMAGLRSTTYRRDGIDCTGDITHAILYEKPDSPPATGADEEIEPVMLFRIALLAAEGQTVCTRYDGSRAEGWRSRALLPDGRDLPGLNDEPSVTRIVPAAPVETLVREGVPTSAAETPET